MAPISEKKTPVPHIKENTKENASKAVAKKSLVIFDFHDSWLRDVELYKNQVKIQQMLTTHNHVHTVDGCSTEPTTLQTTGKRRSQLKTTTDSQNVNGIISFDGIVLKRAREDLTSRLNQMKTNHAGGNNKRNNVHPVANLIPNHQQDLGLNHCPIIAGKIIVNSFHASSLLTSKTVDIVTKSPMPAPSPANYTSLTPMQPNSPRPTPKPPVVANAQNPAVQKAEEKGENKFFIKPQSTLSVERQKFQEEQKQLAAAADEDGGSHPITDDDDNLFDDIGDIDDLHVFDDSDDDVDEYVGFPFMLQSDSDVSHMSEAISSSYVTPQSILTPSLFPNVAPYLTFSSHAERGPPVPTTLHKILKWKLSPVMPRIVRRVIFNSGFRLIKKTTDWMAVWEKHMRSPGFKTIRSHQKFNHLPGSFRIGRKDSMWKNLRGYMSKYSKKEFGFMQKTYILPEELNSLKKAWPRASTKSTKWIVKPPASARGAGIMVVNKWAQIPKDKSLIVQKYIEKPLLINENKFDLRLYILVTSVNPLRIFMYKNGLARFASVKYSSELDSLNDRCMHLTNYSINKLSQNYAKNEDFNACQGHKWTLQSLWTYLEKRDIDTKRLWGTLRNLVIKSIISGEGCLNRMYRQNVNNRYNCYELFGFDVLLDENLVPWLLEINISPSLHSELPLDLHVKGPLIQGVLNTVLYQVPPKLNIRQQAEVLNELQLNGPLCFDRQLFTPILSPEEIKKHNYFTSRLIEYREEYLETILDNLTPDDVRCLVITEDELARSQPLERIFPNANTYKYLQFIENPRYYNRLLDAWETRYRGNKRREGIELLRSFCREGYHLKVPPAALIEEPKIELTDIDLMYMRPEDIAKKRASSSSVTVPLQLNDSNVPISTAAVSFLDEIAKSFCSTGIGDGLGELNHNRRIIVGTNITR